MWKYISEIARLKTPWIELIGERWRDQAGSDLEYWRTVAPDSVIVIPELEGEYLLPQPVFRPGVGKETLDFPGGRLAEGKEPAEMARAILERELGAPAAAVTALEPVAPMPLLINSSTSSQRLHGFHARLDAAGVEGRLKDHLAFAADDEALRDLLARLDCLQCRALLLEHLRNRP